MTLSVEAGDSPVRHLFARPRITTRQTVDGSIILASAEPLKDYARCAGDWLEQAAARVPDRIFLAERARADAPWRQLTYGDALSQVRTVGGWLLDNGLDATRPVAILSENSVDHAVLMLAAMHVGIPVASISPAYALISKSCDKLKDMIALLDPGVIFVSNGSAYQPALAAIEDLHRAPVLASVPAGPNQQPFSSLSSNSRDAVERAFRSVTPDTIAKLLFTSGSTGSPKAVINTQRMMTSNQAAKAQVWPFLEETDDLVILDWLPWSHTFGANHNFNCVLRNRGTLYIDGGKPVPALFELSLANLRDVSPTIYFNVPLGFEMLVQALSRDSALRQRFFEKTRLIFYAGAALPQNIWEALETMSRDTVGYVVPLVSAWGSTETAPMATDCHFQSPRSGNIGVPVPGTELKLVPAGDKLEVRVRGPNVTPGYWKSPEQTRKSFDDEGFYMIGDAVAFASPTEPEKGLFFNGRVSEDFKLLSGTWVSVGRLRIDGVAALAPIAQDIVVTGHDRKDIGFLVFPNLAACRAIGAFAADVPAEDILKSPAIRDRIAQGLAALKARGGGSSTFARYAVLLSEPPSVDQGEITDKGYINQRAVLARRAQALAKLYDDDYPERIECPER
ncbi:feruloyl-CoA synthase [Methylocella sp. CPCC 101449]|uniref:feruloyl-CoA synthase n=1 Tax=Methylocella sp. CPCC 101449 TaxID=2987531 RepID=UPI00288FF754|nr:feruloyl-CoA synthase [Methylocella sp. CPCC 101449]MDT2019389.1 feruloyl-CoA synthase [Methylocella sp. CPCC 101449]